MPYTYNVAGVIGVLQTFVSNVLKAQNEPTPTIPLTYVASQYQLDPNAFPLTLLEVKSIPIDHEGGGSGANNILFKMPVVIHHIRNRQASANAETVGLQRVAAIGAAIESDYHLSAAGGANIPIHTAEPSGLLIGEDNPMQQVFQQQLQSVSIAIVSLPMTIEWYEGAY